MDPGSWLWESVYNRLDQSQNNLDRSQNNLDQSQNHLDRSQNHLDRSQNHFDQSQNHLDQSQNHLDHWDRSQTHSDRSQYSSVHIQIAFNLDRSNSPVWKSFRHFVQHLSHKRMRKYDKFSGSRSSHVTHEYFLKRWMDDIAFMQCNNRLNGLLPISSSTRPNKCRNLFQRASHWLKV